MCAFISTVTNKPTFFFRGCVAEFSYQQTGCYDNGARYHCFDICGEGQHYCNNASLPIFPGLPGSNTADTVGDYRYVTCVTVLISALALLGVFEKLR